MKGPEHDAGEAQVLARCYPDALLERSESIAHDAHLMPAGGDRQGDHGRVPHGATVDIELAPGRRPDEQASGSGDDRSPRAGRRRRAGAGRSTSRGAVSRGGGVGEGRGDSTGTAATLAEGGGSDGGATRSRAGAAPRPTRRSPEHVAPASTITAAPPSASRRTTRVRGVAGS